jgi:hypothetical protein
MLKTTALDQCRKEFTMKVHEIKDYLRFPLEHLKAICEIHGSVLTVEIETKKDRVSVMINNSKGCIILKNFWDDGTFEDFRISLTEIENDIAESVRNDFKAPKHTPLFTTEDIYIAIANEN